MPNQAANLSIKQKELSIPKIDRFISKLEKFNIDALLNRDDPMIGVMESEIDSLLVSIFGPDSIEYERYSHINILDTESISFTHEIPMDRIKESIARNIASAIAILKSIQEEFQNDIHDTEAGSATRTLKSFGGLELHPRIAADVNDLFKNGHYAHAVQDAAKALVNYTKEKSGISYLDGSALMQHVFSPNKPILKFNPLETQSDKDEQQGFMYLFTGAVVGIRNPRAHEKIVDDPERALEFIAFISLLAKLIDETTK